MRACYKITFWLSVSAIHIKSFHDGWQYMYHGTGHKLSLFLSIKYGHLTCGLITRSINSECPLSMLMHWSYLRDIYQIHVDTGTVHAWISGEPASNTSSSWCSWHWKQDNVEYITAVKPVLSRDTAMRGQPVIRGCFLRMVSYLSHVKECVMKGHL